MVIWSSWFILNEDKEWQWICLSPEKSGVALTATCRKGIRLREGKKSQKAMIKLQTGSQLWTYTCQYPIGYLVLSLLLKLLQVHWPSCKLAVRLHGKKERKFRKIHPMMPPLKYGERWKEKKKKGLLRWRVGLQKVLAFD